MRRSLTLLLAVAMMLLTAVMPAGATGPVYPDVIPLPNGFQPEGIAIGNGHTFFTGSLATGDIYRGDLRTGEGTVITDLAEPRLAVGMKYEQRSDALFVAGGPTGGAYVYDATSGDTIAELAFGGGFVNDVVVTRNAAYFTDSFAPVLYRVPLSSAGLPSGGFEIVPLTGDFEFVPGGFNTNGIDATPDGGTLVIVNSTTGMLYTVDPAGGAATLIDLGGDFVASGDGILLDGKSLYVVQNFLNQIAVVALSSDLGSGSVTGVITSAAFQVPTTVAEFGNGLYAVNARFDTPPTPDTTYSAVRVSK